MNPFPCHTDEIIYEAFHAAFQRHKLAEGLVDLGFDKFKEHSRHCHQEEEHRVVLHVGERQVRPVEVVVLDVELAFYVASLVVVRDDFLFCVFPVVGQDGPVHVLPAGKKVAKHFVADFADAVSVEIIFD